MSRKTMIVCIVIGVAFVLAVSLSVGLSAYFLSVKQRTITISFESDEAELKSITVKKGEIPTLPTLEKEGCEFLGWYTRENVKVDDDFFINYDYLEDIVLHDVWRIIDPVTISFDAQGGEPVDALIVPRGFSGNASLQTTREGFYFLGWCFDQQCLSMYFPNEFVVNEDLVLYAKWIPKDIDFDATVSVIFNTNGGDSMETISQKLGDPLTALKPHRVGYVFDGWFSDEELKYAVDANVLVTKSVILYAKWLRNDSIFTITVRFPNNLRQDYVQEYEYDALIQQRDIPTPAIEDYYFNGIYIDDRFSQIATFPFFISTDYIFYLSYTSTIVTTAEVTYVLYEDHQEIRTYDLGAKVELWTPERDGYIFDKWYLDQEFTIEFNDADYTAYTGLTLYAKWINRNGYQDGKLMYRLSEDATYYEVVGEIDLNATHVVIADTFNGLPVRVIAPDVFSGRLIESVTIGKNVQTISERAFERATIKSLIIPAGVTFIGEEAFARCPDLETVTIEGMTVISANAFYECASLREVVAMQVTDIGESAFENCILLESVDISYVVSIGKSAFCNCVELSSILMEFAQAKEILEYTFSNCRSLVSVSVPSSVKTIWYHAFEKTGLRVFDTNKVETIMDYALADCSDLTRINIRASLKSFPLFVIENAEKMNEFTVDATSETFSAIDGSLYSKDGKTFIVCACNKQTVNIDENVTKIELGAFLFNKRLNVIQVSENNTVYASNGGVLFSKDLKTLIYHPIGLGYERYVVPDFVENISIGAFMYDSALKEIVLHDKIKSIQTSAFYYLDNLERIYCPSGLNITFGNDGMVTECPKASIINT